MRPLLKAYIALVVGITTPLLVSNLLTVPEWPHAWAIGPALALLVMTVIGDNLQFEVRRGWSTNASAVSHLAAAFLLPPGLAMAIAMAGAVVRMARHPLPLAKAVFNVASICLAVGSAAHVAGALGGSNLVRGGGAWSDPISALLASAVYCGLSTLPVALAIALDQRRSLWEVMRGKIGVQTVGEVGLGMVGVTLAAMLTSAPNWAPTLLVPAGLLYVAKRSMDRADRRSRNLAITSAVGRAVAGTLDPERAFEAITQRAVIDGLKLDGLALQPTGNPAAFREHVVSDHDRPLLRTALVAELKRNARQIDAHISGGRRTPQWAPASLGDMRIAVAAIPFVAGSGRPVGGLIAWRTLTSGGQAYFDQEELLVLKTLADYAAVALETERLAQETARLYHEAGQAEARREMESLREVARLKDEFLGQVSHELRTPLTIIHGYSELMVDGLMTSDDMVRQSADEIHTSSTLMLRLVDDLLDTSRMDSGRIELKLDCVELGGWLSRVAANFGQTNATHRVVAEIPHELPLVMADVDRLGQVMNNLLSNAVRYSAAGTEITVSASCVGSESVEITVSDHGPGIAAEDRERIFEKFYRGKHGATLAVRGTGLGLAVARQLIEAHGGAIGVRSTLGRGSSFWVLLPVRATNLTPDADVQEPAVMLDAEVREPGSLRRTA